jgi:hypothetical protein
MGAELKNKDHNDRDAVFLYCILGKEGNIVSQPVD